MAARIVVPESVTHPYAYYRDNVSKSLELFDELVALDKPRVVFSSSASLYAFTRNFEVDETSSLAPGSPYARTKMMMEMALEDMAHATALRAIILRYFNPIGSDPLFKSGVHVRDLALAHVAAIEKFDSVRDEVRLPSTIINVGTGHGVTVRELVAAFER